MGSRKNAGAVLGANDQRPERSREDELGRFVLLVHIAGVPIVGTALEYIALKTLMSSPPIYLFLPNFLLMAAGSVGVIAQCVRYLMAYRREARTWGDHHWWQSLIPPEQRGLDAARLRLGSPLMWLSGVLGLLVLARVFHLLGL
jgi:hypothetical protein